MTTRSEAPRPNGLAHRGLKPVEILAANRPHGDRLRYQAGCRCDACRAANADYERGRIHERRAGRANPTVPADRARNWLKHLSAQGIGRQTVADCADVARTILTEIMAGRRQNIRAMTEQKILAVTPEMAADGALIVATETWALVDELVERGFTKLFLAQRLGYLRSLQFGREWVTVRNAARVRKMHRELSNPEMSLVDAAPSRALIAELRGEGFTEKRIARELGDECMAALENQRITKATAHRIDETYRRLTE